MRFGEGSQKLTGGDSRNTLRGTSVLAPERVSEGLERAVAGPDRDLRHRCIGGGKLVCSSLEQEPTSEERGRLADRLTHQPVEVLPREVRALRQVRPSRPVVDALDDDVDETPETVASELRRHVRIMRSRLRLRLIAFAVLAEPICALLRYT